MFIIFIVIRKEKNKKMNETENRKVLISFKISTLVMVVFTIIVVSVIGIVVSNNISKNKKQDVSSKTNYESDEVIATNDEEKKETVKTIKANVTSRSVNTRTENYEEFQNEFEEQTKQINEVEQVDEINQEEVNPIIENPTVSIEDVAISKDMDLTVRTGLSREDFITLISGVEADTSNFFEENAGLIYDVCKKYSINEIFFCGLISAESGWNISTSHRNAHNYISLMSSKGLIKYSSVEEGMEKAAETLYTKYLSPEGKFYNGPTLAGVKTKFCPASSTWINFVYKMMEQIVK